MYPKSEGLEVDRDAGHAFKTINGRSRDLANMFKNRYRVR